MTPRSGSVLHIGDTHVGANRRQGDREDALRAILERARTLSRHGTLDWIAWPGDLYHAASSPEDRNIIASVLVELAALAPVVIVRGNHDVRGDLAILARLAEPGRIRVFESPDCVDLIGEASRARYTVAVLPYPERAGYIAAGVAADDQVNQGGRDLDLIMTTIAAALEARRDEGARLAFVTHANVSGAVSSTGQPQIGHELELSSAMLDRLPEETAVLGSHIHKHQQIGRLVYAGSITRLDFGENEPKGVVVWTWPGTVADVPTWLFHELDTPRQVLIEMNVTTLGIQVVSVDGVPAEIPPDIPGADVRIRYRFRRGDAGAIDVAAIRALVPRARTVVLDPVAIAETVARAPAVQAAETFDDKVRAYGEAVGVDTSIGVIRKAGRLRGAADLAEVLEAVGREYAEIGAEYAN